MNVVAGAWLADHIVDPDMACAAPRSRHNGRMGDSTFDRDEAGDPVYAFKASLNGAMCEFALKPEAMHWQKGRRSGRLRYERIRAIRMSYRPVSMQSHRFVTEIWSADNPKIQIVSVSWRSMIQQERLDASYSAFITELHHRLAAGASGAQFLTGLPVIIYWIGVVIFGGVLVAAGALTLRSMNTAQFRKIFYPEANPSRSRATAASRNAQAVRRADGHRASPRARS
jgi:hypothetical protein